MVFLKRNLVASLFFVGLSLNINAMIQSPCGMQNHSGTGRSPIGTVIFIKNKKIAEYPVLITQLRVLTAIEAEKARHNGNLLTLDIHDCGVHAVCNLVSFMRGDGDQLKALLEDDTNFKLAYTLCMEVNGTVDFLRKDSEVMVRRLLKSLFQKYEVSINKQNNVTIIGGAAEAKLRELTSELVSQQESTKNTTDVVGLCGGFNLPALEGMELIDFLLSNERVVVEYEEEAFEEESDKNLEDVSNLGEMLREIGRRLRRGNTQYFLVCSYGHWLAFKFEWVSNEVLGLCADSSSGDITSIHIIDRILTLMLTE